GAGDARLWQWEGVCRLAAGDTDGYRQVCADALGKGGEQVPEVAMELARLCVYRRDGVVGFAGVVRLARTAWEHAKGDRARQAILGAALLRAGRLEEAGKHLESAGDQPEALLFLALLRVRQRALEPARRLLEKGRKVLAGSGL